VNWGDGQLQTVQNLSIGAFSINHTYLNNVPGQSVSSYTVSTSVTDEALSGNVASTGTACSVAMAFRMPR